MSDPAGFRINSPGAARRAGPSRPNRISIGGVLEWIDRFGARGGPVDVALAPFALLSSAGLLVAATPRGVSRIWMVHPASPDSLALESFLAQLEAAGIPPSFRARNRVLRKCLEELAGYFQGCLRKFETPVDWAGQGTPFERRIWSRLRRIPYGKTASYGQLARSLCGRSALGPRAMGPRAVGQANGRNPVPILVPCHRVIAADGTLGGYSGGLEVKKALLELEGATVAGVEPS